MDGERELAAHLKGVAKQATPNPQRQFPWLTTLAVLGVSASALGEWSWLLDLASHFLPYYGLALSLTMLWLLWQRRWRAAGIAALALGYCLYQVGPYFVTRNSTVGGEPFSVMVCNVLSHNSTPELVLDWLRAQPADIAVILEVTPSWVPRLESLADVYPHRSFKRAKGTSASQCCRGDLGNRLHAPTLLLRFSRALWWITTWPALPYL